MKIFKNTKKRIGAALMLVWLAFFVVGGTAAFAAANTNLSKPVELNFDGTTATNLAIIRGVNIVINATNTADRAPLANPIKLIKNYESGDQREDHTQYFKVSGEKHRMTVHPYLRSELDPADQAFAAENNYTITSNYGTMKWEADIANQIDANGRASGTLVLRDASGKNGLNILTDSYVKMEYKDGYFTLVNDGTATGIFRDFAPEVNSDISQYVPGGPGVNEKFVLTMNEKQIDAGGGGNIITRRTFEFEPRQIWDETLPDGTKVTHHTIRDGSIYEIHYQFVMSYPLTLTVMDPEKVLKDIGSNATNTDFKSNEYINPVDATNTNSFITNNLSLKSSVIIHGQDVLLEWKWIPDGANPSEAEKNAINIVAVAGKPSAAEVTRMENDIQGELQVKAYYSAGQLNNDVNGDIIYNVPITIKGRGTPASIKTITGYVGHGVNPDTTVVIKDANQNLPKNIEMNVYKNDVTGYPETTLPYAADFLIHMGADNGRATQMYVDLLKADGSVYTGPTAASATIVTKTGIKDYVFGTSISAKDLASTTFKVYANGAVDGLKLRFRFFVVGFSGDREEIDARVEIPLTIQDTTPDVTAQLSKLSVQSKNIAVPGFTFNPDITNYVLPVEYKSTSLVFTPTKYKSCHDIIGLKVEILDDMGLWKEATIDDGWESKDNVDKEWVESWDNQSAPRGYSIRSGKSVSVNPKPGKTMRVSFTVRAQHPNQTKTYAVEVTKAMPSTNSFLKTIIFTDETGKNLFTQKLVDGQFDYSLEVPFKTQYLQIVPTPQDSGAFIQNDPNGVSDYAPRLVKRDGMVFDTNDWWKLTRPDPDPNVNVTNEMKIKVNAESNQDAYASNYTFNVTFAKPSTDSSLNKLTLTDNKKGNIAYTPAFHPAMEADDYYEATVPFEVDTVNVAAVPNHAGATQQLVYKDLTTGLETKVELSRTNPVGVKLPILPNLIEYYQISVVVTAEDMGTATTYPVRIHRTPPSKEASLSSLVIKNEKGTDLATLVDYAFNTEKLSYSFNVPYETRKVSFTPTASFDNVSGIKLNGLTLPNKGQSALQALNDALVPTQFEVEVFPQDVSVPSKIYTIIITRQAPSTDARLKGLAITGVEEYKPMFTPANTKYSANISKGGGAIITATANHPEATITVRGIAVASGEAADPINLMELNETVEIVVTAQDGTTTMTYTVELMDLNLVELSGNADLKSLSVSPGVPTPTEFQPAVTDYKVAVTEEVASVKLLPVPADPAAKLRVFAGSKEIGDYSGNYAQAIEDGENPFTVEVTSPDGKNKKEYAVNVYRNDEENSGVLKPITPSDVNYELGNPIIVDISKYNRVSAEVFVTLRDKYPDKTIVFEGNDYSLSFKASELSKNIPITTVYDFGLKFSVPSPTDAALNAVLAQNPQNALLDIVYITFGYHGDLPGNATLNLTLGQKYGNRTLYWHYFNEERARVDYYGKLTSNSRGTVGVKLTHMSTYMVSPSIIYGSEDRSGNINLTPGKDNPNTLKALENVQKRAVKK